MIHHLFLNRPDNNWNAPRIEVDSNAGYKCGLTRVELSDDGIISVNGKTIVTTGDDLIKLLSDVVEIN